jgi:hypothetical protein
VNAPDGPEENLSLAAMVENLRKGEPVDRDAMRDALLARAEELGLPRRDVARFAGRARWEAERRAGEGRPDCDEG